jgi:hypothetical protein
MRIALKSLGVLVLAALSFAAGAITAGMRHWYQPVVRVTIENHSGRDLSSLRVSHGTGGVKSVTILPALKQGQSTDASFFVAGEGGYEVEATLANGQILKGGAGYVESGYTSKEIIGESKITSKQNTYGY